MYLPFYGAVLAGLVLLGRSVLPVRTRTSILRLRGSDGELKERSAASGASAQQRRPDWSRSRPMAGFASSRAASLALAAFLTFLNLFAFLLAVGAERRRSTGKVVPDEYDDRSYCLYDTDASTVYGVAAFFVLLLEQVLVTGVTRCLCLGPALSSRGCALAAFVLSWLTFLTAEACLIGGSARNAYHTKYLGYYMKHDLVSCATLRRGVFAAAAGMMLINHLASLVYYWSYSKAANGGFVKHQNEVGMGMTDYGHDKGGSGS